MKKILVILILVALVAIAIAGCGKGTSNQTSQFSEKLGELSTTFASFEKVLEGAPTLDAAKNSEQYTKLVKVQEEINQLLTSSTVTDDEKSKLEIIEQLINLVVNQ
jgi:hypothetical protein